MNVSIIIPAYNAATTLEEAVGSIQRQTATDWEILIVNDGSQDDTGMVAAALAEADGRIQVLTQANAGESAARNAGISQARHEWLLFLDADDWLAPDHLERLLAAVDADPSLDAVHCGWARVAQDGTEIIEDYRPATSDLFPVLARRAAFPVHACLVRRSLVESAGRFDISLRKSPDWDLWQRIARCGAKFGSVPEVLAYYRMAPNSASLDAEQMLRDGLTVLRRGHGADPRVRNPLPQYAHGLAGSSVESQEYYLLSWCAGLLLGTGRDAERLLRLVNGEKYTGLYPNAIAQCIFDAATLPACLPRQAWEDLWRRISGPTTAFLRALELHTQTAGLAEVSLRELKKLILRNSPVWGDVIHQEETSGAALEDTIAKLSEGSAWLVADRDEWRLRARESERHHAGTVDQLLAVERRVAELTAETSKLDADLQGSRGQLEELTLVKDQLQRQLSEAEARTATLTAQLRTAVGLNNDLERRHAEAAEELAGARRTILSLQQRVTSTDLELAGERARINELERHGDSLDLQLTAMRGRVQELEQQREYISGELANWRESATARAMLIEDLQQDAWMRLGLWLRTTRRRQSEPATTEMSDAPEPAAGTDLSADPAIEARWHLRVADGNEATLIYPREDHEMVKIGIAKAATKSDWDIQLNRLGLQVTGGVRYAVAFRARARRPREIGVGFAKAHDPWTTLGMYTRLRLTPEWQTFQEEFIALEDEGEGRIHFDLGGRKIGVDLTSVVLRAVEQNREAMGVGAGTDRDATGGPVL